MQFSNILITVVAVLVSHAAAHPAAGTEAAGCWFICGDKDLECPKGMVLEGKPGGCYTCCFDDEA
ncbi:hypothetical protein FQN54_006777 [Arachnomyces sp. PD_36]|nr:hypothetical protein FQN54_006777 [Arachnomyces sp. PD_36]